MSDPRRHAAALLAVLLLAAPSAAFADSTLLAQIEDATPTPTAEGQPPLVDDLPEEPADGGERDDGDAPKPRRAAEPEPLPETGIESGLLALLGLGLIATGSGLRLRLGRSDAV